MYKVKNIYYTVFKCEFSCCDKILTKTNMWRTGFIWLIGSVSRGRKPSKEIKAGTVVLGTEETMEE